MRTNLRDLVLAGLFAALTAVAAQLSFTLPVTGVPFTLQVLVVLLAGLLLGARWGAVSMVVYLALGAAGLPVFAKFSSGVGTLLGPTGGYLWSYPLAAFVTGLFARPRAGEGFRRLFLAGLPGLLIIYAGGAGWVVLVGGKAVGVVMAGWVVPFVPYDLAKVGLAAGLARSVRAALQAMGWRREPA